MVLVLNLALVGALVIIGLTARSLGLLAAGVDYLADAAAIGVSILAIRLSHQDCRRRASSRNATDIAALINAGWLLILNIGVAVAAVRRLVSGAVEVRGMPVLIMSGIAALAMLVGAVILGGELYGDNGGQDLNVKAVRLDTAADAAAAAGVASTGAVIVATGGWFWLDPAVALAISAVFGYHAVQLIRLVLIGLRNSPNRRPGVG